VKHCLSYRDKLGYVTARSSSMVVRFYLKSSYTRCVLELLLYQNLCLAGFVLETITMILRGRSVRPTHISDITIDQGPLASCDSQCPSSFSRQRKKRSKILSSQENHCADSSLFSVFMMTDKINSTDNEDDNEEPNES